MIISDPAIIDSIEDDGIARFPLLLFGTFSIFLKRIFAYPK
jgi:hypothetical protein